MNINSMVNSYLFTMYGGDYNKPSGPNFRDNPAVSRPEFKPKDVSQSTAGKAVVEDAQVKISSLGKASHSIDEVQKSAKPMQEISKIETLEDAKAAAETFVKAFNQQQTMLADNALDDKALTASLQKSQEKMLNAFEDELSAMGIERTESGRLTLDESQLASAFAADKTETLINFSRVSGAAIDMTRAQEREVKLTSSAVLNNVMEFGAQKGAQQSGSSNNSNSANNLADIMAQAQENAGRLRDMIGGFGRNNGANMYQSIFNMFR